MLVAAVVVVLGFGWTGRCVAQTNLISTHSATPVSPVMTSTSVNGRIAEPRSSAAIFGRTSVRVHTALTPITSKISPSVILIVDEFDQTSLGTVVSADGLVVAKHSRLKSGFHCVMPDGTKHKAKIRGVQPHNDLALIEIVGQKLTPVSFSRRQPTRSGEIVVSVGVDNQSVGFGMVSVIPQTFQIKQPECPDCIDLGATVSQFLATIEYQPDAAVEKSPSGDVTSKVQLQAAAVATGLKVFRVYPRTASESTGLLVGDMMHSINGVQLTSRQHMNEIAKQIKVGQTLKIGVVRKGVHETLSTKVKGFAKRTIHDRWGGGPYSQRRFGFGTVVAHDSVVDPDHCGSPLIDLQGRLVGINIARSMRVATFAIPSNDVYHFIKRVRPNAELKFEDSPSLQSSGNSQTLTGAQALTGN